MRLQIKFRNRIDARAFKCAAMVLPVIAVIGVALWQQVRLKELTAESAGLREQLAQAMSAREESERLLKLDAQIGEGSGDSPQLELLRLRGEVAVLRRQLNDAARATAAQGAHPRAAELESVAPTLLTESDQSAPSASRFTGRLTEQLTAQQERLATARQKVADLAAALDIPQDISILDSTTALRREELKSYWPYFEAKRILAVEERSTQYLEMSLSESRPRQQ